MRDLQKTKLKELIKYSYENVPYYNEVFKRAGLRPTDISELEDLCKVPILKRQVLVNHSASLLSDRVSREQLVCWETSGTTSVPVKLYRSKLDVGWGIAGELRGYGWAGYEVGDRLALVWAVDVDRSKSFGFRLRNSLKNSVLLNSSTLSETSMESFARKVERFKPDYIRGYATAMNVFACFVRNAHRRDLRPQAIFTSAATLFPHYRRNIEDVFKCKVYDYYATSEISHVAAQCGQHEGLHVTEENVIVEIVKDGENAAPGETGKVLLTNLNSHSMPFIRYDIGDLGKIYQEGCSCGRSLRLMKPIGRKYEYFLNSDGSFTSLHDLQTLFEDLPIDDFQIVQESLDDIVVRVVRRHSYTEEHSSFILRHIKFKGNARIRIKFVDKIPLEKGGKLRHSISRIASEYALD